MLEAGADVNIECEHNTALNLASRGGLYETVDLLIRAGADVNKVPEDGKTALMEASGTSERGEPGDTTKCLKLLIEAGADVNAVTSYGSALTTSVSYGIDIEKLQLLIRAGADVNFVHSDGSTAFNCVPIRTHALYDQWTDCCHYSKLLLRSGAKINIGNSGLGNALRQLVEYYDVKDDLCRFLYAAGETLDGIPDEKIPDCLKFDDVRLDLKHICREAIRKHLLNLDPHTHLFVRVPKLGLPSLLNEYLLYNMSLDDNIDDNNGGHGDIDDHGDSDDNSSDHSDSDDNSSDHGDSGDNSSEHSESDDNSSDHSDNNENNDEDSGMDDEREDRRIDENE